MNKLSCIAVVVLATTSLVSTLSFAEPKNVSGFNNNQATNMAPQGFNNAQAKTVAEILDNAKDHDVVVVQGRLTAHIHGDNYEFTDKNNDKIEVELDDDKDWSFISKDQNIEIVAEVDKDLLHIELEVIDAKVL